MTSFAFSLEPIDKSELRSNDLRQEVRCCTGWDCQYVGAQAYTLTIYDASGQTPMPETAEVLFFDGLSRLGIAWGADADWMDAIDIKTGINLWLTFVWEPIGSHNQVREETTC
jgi:hypothetical protein